MSAPPSPLPPPVHPNAELLQSALKGFDFLFANDIVAARKHFEGKDDPFNLMGSGVCSFLEAALGMETSLLTEASRSLTLSEAGARKHMKSPKPKLHSRFPAGLEWEIVNADAVVLLGLTHALSETYMGYLQCMYSLNNAHSKFTKLYKTVFPNGIDDEPSLTATSTNPANTSSLAPPHSVSHKASFSSLASASSASSAISASSTATVPVSPHEKPAAPAKSFFSRWISSTPAAASSEPALPLHPHLHRTLPDGPVEDLIVAGTAFGYGLFNLVFSLLPKKVQSLVGFLGFQHDRKLALKALALSASKNDVHGIFAGLVLMTYHGVVLLLSGYQADEARIIKQYQDLVDKIQTRYPDGALWILNRAKILRMSHDADGAIRVLQDGLKPERPHTFAQADMMLLFELAWTLLGQRRYQEAADVFLKITELNSWSHATYYFLAAGCNFALGNQEKTQSLLDAISGLIDKKKVGGKDLPTEVFIKKKLAFYKEKQKRRGGDESKFAQAIRISPAEEIAIFWNTHTRIDKSIAKAHIAAVATLSPPLSYTSPIIAEVAPSALVTTTPRASTSSRPHTPRTPKTPTNGSTVTISSSSAGTGGSLLDLDTPDELALRSLLVGICHRTCESHDAARDFLAEAHAYHSAIKTNTWIGGVAAFELAVLELKEVEWRERGGGDEGDGVEGDGVEGGLEKLKIGDEKSTGNGHAQTKANNANVDWKSEWAKALKSASAKLDEAVELAPNTVDLSSRLDSRVLMLRDEIALKREMLGIRA